jgi:rubrerythrin
MRTLLLFSVLATLTLYSCQKRPNATIANLQVALVDETSASKKYADYATKANEEGFLPIAKLFEALSRSENVHAERNKEFLNELDVIIKDFTTEKDTKSTAENLESALQMENNDVENLYLKFITTALSEKMIDIAENMNWAYSTEKKHQLFLKDAIRILKTQPDSLALLPSGYIVCPICGNTYDSSEKMTTCANCSTTRDLFIELLPEH